MSGKRPWKPLFSFPNPVNERAARTVAGGVLLLSVVTLIPERCRRSSMVVAIRGARVRLFARVADRADVEPARPAGDSGDRPKARAGASLSPRPPKRFAQSIGAFVTTAIVILVALGLAWCRTAIAGRHGGVRDIGVGLRVLRGGARSSGS